MRRVLPKSLFGQLLWGTILVQTLLLVLFIWYTVVSQRKGSDQRSRDRIVQQLNRLSTACSVELAHNDMKAVRTALELSRIAPTIEVARLTDLAGRTLAVTDSADGRGLDQYESAVLPSATRQQIFTIKNDQMEAVTPVLAQGKPVALLWLEPNHAVSQTTAILVRTNRHHLRRIRSAGQSPAYLSHRSHHHPAAASAARCRRPHRSRSRSQRRLSIAGDDHQRGRRAHRQLQLNGAYPRRAAPGPA